MRIVDKGTASFIKMSARNTTNERNVNTALAWFMPLSHIPSCLWAVKAGKDKD